MIKLFNPTTVKVVKTQEKQCIVETMSIKSEWFDLPVAEAYAMVLNSLKGAIENKELAGKKFYLKVVLLGDDIERADVETAFDFIESVATKLLVTDVHRAETRLGMSTADANINLKTASFLKWTNFETRCGAFGFEVEKEGGSWKKRMVK